LRNINLLAAFVLTIVVLSSSVCSAQTKGGRWMFENNGNDEATWDNVHNNGSLSGAAFFSNADQAVQGDYYLSLEDSSEYGVLTVPDQEELDFLDESFAASLWFYPVESYDNPQFLLIKGERSGTVKTNNYALRINKDYPELIVHSESGANSVAKSSFKVVKNQWNFLAVYYDYDNSKLYIWNDKESVPIDTMDFDAPLFPNNDKLYVGTSGENGFKRFWGRIDDIRIGNQLSDIIDQTTDVELSAGKNLPSGFALSQNYPNPFNPETVIKFSLDQQGFTKLRVYNLLGAQVALLVNGELNEGQHEVRFNASNLPSGVYLYKLQQGNRSELKKMILIK
jgi:hypothetical protein